MTLGHVLEDSTRRNPERTALIRGEDSVTYIELDRRASLLAHWFILQGLRPGDRVAFYWSNSIEIVVLFLGCWKAGLIAVPFNIRLKAPELAYVLGHSESSICFVQPALESVARQALDIGALTTPLYTRLPEPAFDVSEPLPHVTESDISVILYTSGTTARPKGVAHTHQSLLGGARLMLAMIGDTASVSMVPTHMAHGSGLICVLLPSILSGGTTVLMPSFDPAAMLDNIERFEVTYTGGLPAMITLMIQGQQNRPRNIRSLKTFIGGGDTVPVALQNDFAGLFGVPVLELLAMTESCPMCWNPADDIRPGSVGKARAGVEFRVIGLDGAPGKSGELLVRSPANFREYWRDAELTSVVMRDGWVHTGDLVEQDAEGYLRFTGRLKHIIIRGGSNIAPPEVEEALYHHPAVREAAVVGLPDVVYGQKVAAFLVLREGFSADENALREFARERLSDYKVPEVIRFLPDLPKGLTGKVDRLKLAEL